MIQSRSSSPSSEPPGPPRTGRNSRGCHSTPSSARFVASSRCRSSILVFSLVARSWFLAWSAWTVLYHSFCDSRSDCSSRGRVEGGVCFALVALKSSSFFPVWMQQISRVLTSGKTNLHDYSSNTFPHSTDRRSRSGLLPSSRS